MTHFPGGRPLPPAVAMLGYELSWARDGTAEVLFTAQPSFANLMGNVQGGFVAAMLDATAATALLAQLPVDQVAPTIEMKTSFFRPVPLGRLIARGKVLHRGTSIAFLEASLYAGDDADPAGNETLLAAQTATARIVHLNSLSSGAG